MFRPPYGDYDTTTLRLAQRPRMAVWLWSVDTEYWKARGPASAYWVNRIVRLAEQEGGALANPRVLADVSPTGGPEPSRGPARQQVYRHDIAALMQGP